jgi:superfamily II DNA/RNA helicase
MTFNNFALHESILKSVADAGYNEPTPIQQAAIPTVLEGRDVFGCAQTGTGKTASFMLPLLSKLQEGRVRARMPRALVLTPTRELAQQVQEAAEKYGKNTKLGVVTLIGGESMAQQEKELKKRVDILIATPGRMLDILERGSIMLGALEFLVIDEADRLLDMGFVPDVEKIVSKTPTSRQTLLFSATVSVPIRKLAERFLKDPAEITITPKEVSAETIEQVIVETTATLKPKALRHYLALEKPTSAIIFCNRKLEVSKLCRDLKKQGFSVGELHGDLSQSQRKETLDAFKEGKLSLLVASDVAARGIDVADLPMVFNLGLPLNPEEYVHRIGRTGRAGNSGKAITFVDAKEQRNLKALEKMLGKALPKQAFKAEEEKPAAKEKETKQVKDEIQEIKVVHVKERRPKGPPLPKGPVLGFGDSVPAFFLVNFSLERTG